MYLNCKLWEYPKIQRATMKSNNLPHFRLSYSNIFPESTIGIRMVVGYGWWWLKWVELTQCHNDHYTVVIKKLISNAIKTNQCKNVTNKSDIAIWAFLQKINVETWWKKFKHCNVKKINDVAMWWTKKWHHNVVN